jgi:molybdenum cofactor cytidylyltransferase
VIKRIEGILLAAGESRRMGYPKALLRIGDTTFIQHLARLMLGVTQRLTIVVGVHAQSCRATLAADARISVVDNPDYAQGQLSSIWIGLRSLSADCDGAIVHLVDHPLVRASTFNALISYSMAAGKPIAIARYQGRRGHPVLFGREVFDELMSAPLSEGARVVVSADPGRVAYLDVDDPGVVLDLDSPADLERAGLPPVPGQD